MKGEGENLKQTPHWAQSLTRSSIPQPGDHDLSWNQESALNQLSHSGTLEKAVLRGTFIAMQAYLKKQEKSEINNLTLHQKELEKVQGLKPKHREGRKVVTIRREINDIKKL